MSRELLKQALEVLDSYDAEEFCKGADLMKAIKAELAKPEQEPVVWRSWHDKYGVGYWETRDEAELNSAADHEPEPLYAAPVDCKCLQLVPAPRGFIQQPSIDGVVRTPVDWSAA